MTHSTGQIKCSGEERSRAIRALGYSQLAQSHSAPDLAKRRYLLRRLLDQSVVELRMATMLLQAASSAAESGGWGSSTGGLGSSRKKKVLRRLSSVDEYDQLLSCH